MSVILTTAGIEDAIDALQKRGAKALDVLEPPLRRGALRIESTMKVYPQQKKGTRYRRTGTLGRRWTTKAERSATRLEVEVGNNTVYGPFVQSAARQAWMHKGAWQTDDDAVERNRDAIITDVQRTVIAAME